MTGRICHGSVLVVCCWLLSGAVLATLCDPYLGASRGEGPIDQARRKYAELVAQTYSYRFGKGKPFLPSNARIEGDEFIQPGAFPTAAYCRSCHEATYHQWRQSLHANSFRTPFYTKNVGLLQNTKGIEFSRHCEGCHNPIELFSGQVTPNPAAKDREFDQDGVTCMVCHSITKLQPTYGLGSYVMGAPAVMVNEYGKPIPGEVSYAEIFDHVDRHKAAVMKDFYRTPEFCAACHKANIPGTLNGYKWLRAIGLYDEWQRSSYAKQSPLPFYNKDFQSCQNCHMPRETAQQNDAASKQGTIVSHRWVGGNTAVPFLYGYDEQLKKTLEYLAADKVTVDIFAIARADGTGLVAPFGTKSFTVKPGDELQAMAVIQNKGVGHTLVPEQRDIYQAWVEFDLRDANGATVYASGGLGPDGSLDPNAHSFVTRLLDADGQLLTKHEIWNRRFTGADATIKPGRSTVVRYGFDIPKAGSGPYTITVRVNYRHFNELFTNFALGKDHPTYPIARMAVQSRELKIGTNKPLTLDPRDNPDWMRWNNFGIALLDQGRYPESVQAFRQVLTLRSDYADAYTNLGIVYLQWERFTEAASSFGRALTMQPGNIRSLYYRGVVENHQGDFDAAVADLQKVTKLFPHSAEAHEELGFCYYRQHKYDLAEAEYETVQRIEPDDLSAHYYLAIIYRRESKSLKAAAQAALFADEKDDPMANAAVLEFQRNHAAMAEEGIAWHLHEVGGTRGSSSKR